MTQRRRLIVAIALCGAAAAIAAVPLHAQQVPMLKPAGSPWSVKEDIPEGKDVSGIACVVVAPNVRRCILAVDEAFSAVLATLEDRTVKPEDVIRLMPEAGGKEFDAEAAAYDPQTNSFYVIGSHGKSRHKCEDNAAAYHLVRIPVDPKTGRPSFDFKNKNNAGDPRAVAKEIVVAKSLKPAMVASDKIGPHVDKCLGTKNTGSDKVPFVHEQGANIEGLAIFGSRLFVGFRGPVKGGTAFMLAFDRDAVFAQENAKATTIPVDLGAGMGVRDLAAVAGGLLILSGPEDDVPGMAALHFFDESKGTVSPLGLIPNPTHQGKPEGLLLLEETNSTYRLLIVSDGVKNGEPTEFLVDKKN